jgi:hypothetical protein
MTSIVDDFQRPDGALGLAPGGLPWTLLAGGVTIASHKASSSNVASSSPPASSLAVLPLSADGTFTMTIPAYSAGASLYFRVTDVNNWWRLRVYGYQSSSQYVSSYTCHNEYYSDFYHDDAGNTFWYETSRTIGGSYASITDGSGYYHDGPASNDVYYADGKLYHTPKYQEYCTPNYATQYYNNYLVYLDKCVAGTVTTTSTTLSGSAATYSVVLSGSAMTIKDGTTTEVMPADSFNETAINAGIGLGYSPLYYNPTTFTEFTASFTGVGDSAGAVRSG